VWEKGTERAMSLALRSCSFAEVSLSRIQRSHVEAWIKTLAGDLAPSTVKTRYGNVRNILRAAVRDRLVATDPSDKGVVLPGTATGGRA
jgi:hypothetical protein